MPLSEHEQRMLQQMEQALYEGDPKFAHSLRNGSGVPAARGLAAGGALTFLAGLAALFGGVIVPLVPLGVVGFLAMLVGAVLFHGATRRTGGAIRRAPSAMPVGGGGGSMMNRFEERWRRRQQRGS